MSQINDNQEFTFIIEHDEELKRVTLVLVSSKSLTPEQCVQSLNSIISDLNENPKAYFSSMPSIRLALQ